MKIPRKLPQCRKEKIFIVVSAKETGVVYVAHNSIIERIAKVEKHPETYSDKEGFFLQSGAGSVFGSGAPLEINEEHNIKFFMKALTDELDTLVSTHAPHAIYLFYPEHLKGYFEKVLKKFKHVPSRVILYGNFLHLKPLALLQHTQRVFETKTDPADPSSVLQGPNASEKRKILAVGQ